MKDIETVKLVLNDGTKKDALVICTVKVPDKNPLLIYTLDGELYGAKYSIKDNETILDTDLSDEEIEILDKTIEKLGDNNG